MCSKTVREHTVLGIVPDDIDTLKTVHRPLRLPLGGLIICGDTQRPDEVLQHRQINFRHIVPLVHALVR